MGKGFAGRELGTRTVPSAQRRQALSLVFNKQVRADALNADGTSDGMKQASPAESC